MKTKKYLFITILTIFIMGCNESEILKEVPEDFFTVANAYQKPSDADFAINGMFTNAHSTIAGIESVANSLSSLMVGTDICTGARNTYSHYRWLNTDIQPSNDMGTWLKFYKLIANANTLLNRIDGISYSANEEALKQAHIAEARFFRAYAYRGLAHLYGGVPLELKEVTSPRRDYTRASREDVYKQCKEDLEYAVQYLPTIDKVKIEGRISKAAAYQLLAEIYISLKEYDKAITACSNIIDNPIFGLMTERFGRRKNEPGDVYWDLHQRGNQSRTSGNKESIWFITFSPETPGGSSGYGKSDANTNFERIYGPCFWAQNTPDGKVACGKDSWQGGAPGGYAAPSSYVKYTIWKDNWQNDIRNSKYNIFRDFTVTNKKSTWYGRKFSEFKNLTDTIYTFYPYHTMLTTPNDHPAIMLNSDGIIVYGGAATCHDWYVMRVAETYLLRAEAYLGKGDKKSAAADINKVRGRAQAKPVAESDVNIDYILDERARELYIEEPRRMTLNRLGKLVERARKYNEYSKGMILDHYNLLPIPFDVIELNTLGVIEQNPGYVN